MPVAIRSLQPRVALICHEDDPIDRRGLAGWLATSLDLVGLVVISSNASRRFKTVRREWRRSGFLGVLDAAAFRAYYAMTSGARDRAWVVAEASRLAAKYPVAPDSVPQVTVTDPNAEEAVQFLARTRPDIILARCKTLLRPAVLNLASTGTCVLHPGICPEYRNAHGCFWALACGDLERVGMTLLVADRGVDTGPAYLQATYAFDEQRESHVVMQYRVVTENLDAVAETLRALTRGSARRLETSGHASRAWGQPRLSAFWAWRRDARQRALGQPKRIHI